MSRRCRSRYSGRPWCSVNSSSAIALFSYNWSRATTKNTAVNRTKFAGQILTMAGGVLNPVKFFTPYGPGVVGALDVLTGLGAASCIWAVLGANWDK